jgi:hypothetical protein
VGSVNVMSRVVLAPLVVMSVAVFWVAATANADPPPTQVITTVAVGPDGQPINGFQVASGPGNVGHVSDCSTPSRSAVADNVYSCSPSVADAGTCWPATPGSLLCVDDPWEKRMHRVTYDGPLPPVTATANPEPFALTLDDGTRCLIRNGGGWGVRADGYEGAYGCSGSGARLAVLCLSSQGAGSCIDRSSPAWTVEVGALGTPNDALPPPQTHTVTEAWLAGGRAGQ